MRAEQSPPSDAEQPPQPDAEQQPQPDAEQPANELSASAMPSAPTLPPSLVEGRRIKGSIHIPPDDLDKVEMVKRELTCVHYAAKLCIGADGGVSSITVVQSSGLPRYDEKIRKRITSSWRYSPFQINGTPQPICTSVAILYNQRLPPPSRYRFE